MSLSVQVLAYLSGRTTPVRTAGIIGLFAEGRRNGRSLVWDVLRKLERRGHIRKVTRSSACTTWEFCRGSIVRFSPTGRLRKMKRINP